MGQHALAVAQKLGPKAADLAAHPPVFLVDRPGLGQRSARISAGRKRPRRSAAARFMRVMAQKRFTAVGRLPANRAATSSSRVEEGHLAAFLHRLQAQADAVGRGDPDRRTTDPQRLDRFHDRFHVPAINLHVLDR